MGWTGSAVAAGSCCEGPCLERVERSLTGVELEEQDNQRRGEREGQHNKVDTTKPSVAPFSPFPQYGSVSVVSDVSAVQPLCDPLPSARLLMLRESSRGVEGQERAGAMAALSKRRVKVFVVDAAASLPS